MSDQMKGRSAADVGHRSGDRAGARPVALSTAKELEQGMLVLAPFGKGDGARLVLWMVIRTNKTKNKATMLAHCVTHIVQVQTTTLTPPDGWRIINNEYAAQALDIWTKEVEADA